MTISYIDIIIFFIILISLFVGFSKGFIKETLSLATLVAAVAAAFYLSEYLVDWLPGVWTGFDVSLFGASMEGRRIALVFSFILIFLLVLITGRLVTERINRAANEGPFHLFNILLGGLFGFVRGAFIVILLVALGGLTKAPASDWWRESSLLPPFVDGAQYAAGLLPQSYAVHLDFSPAEGEGDGEDNTEIRL